jgi:GT2 family glycosyltransferase
MNKTDVLVVTATLGDRNSLEKTIKSVSTIGNTRVFHVIIAPEKKSEYLQNKFPNIKVISEPEKCNGIYEALNFALKKYAQHYKYLAFINDDDYWLPDYVKLIEELDNNPQADAVYGKVCYIDEKDKIIGIQTSSSRYKAFGVLLSKNIILFTQQATLIRSDLFLKIGGFDESFKLIADTNFWLEAINSNAKFLYKDLICAAYMIQQGQLSSNGKLQKEEHMRLSSKIKSKSFLIVVFEKWLFRFSNFNIYINRLLKNKKIVRMGQLFHN